MTTYYYVHTGHRIGLDRFRRAVAILKELDADITLLTSDYRIAHVSRDFGIEKSVGLDVVRNIPQIAVNGDRLIFDSDEANPIMIEDMKQYFSTFIPIQTAEVAIEKKFFEAKTKEKDVELSFFFGDDDYEKDLEKHIDFIEDLHPHLQLGFYYFLDYETMLQKRFENCFEFEEYDAMIMNTQLLITCSPQAVLDSLASGGSPVYVQREDYTQEFNELFETLNIPIIYNYDKNHLSVILQTIDDINYVEITQNANKMTKIIKDELNLN